MRTITTRVQRIEQLTPTIRLFEFGGEGEPLTFEPGAHVDVEVSVDDAWETRSYSLVRIDDSPAMRIAVKRAEVSRGGSHYMWSLKPGDEVRLRETKNTFPISVSSGGRWVLLAAGIGVTPLLGIARLLKARGVAFDFHYCVRDPDELAFLKELRETCADSLHLHDDAQGTRLNIDEWLKSLEDGTRLVMCGPLPMMDIVRSGWAERGMRSEHLIFESFANSGQFDNTAFEVVVAATGQRVRVASDKSMLDALLDAGIDMMYQCRIGQCGLCKVEVLGLDGKLDHRDVFFGDADRAYGDVMCCCVSRVSGSGVTVAVNGVSYGKRAPGH